MGKKFGYEEGELPITEDVSKRLLRLPFYNDLIESDQERIVTIINNFASGISYPKNRSRRLLYPPLAECLRTKPNIATIKALS